MHLCDHRSGIQEVADWVELYRNDQKRHFFFYVQLILEFKARMLLNS